MKTSDRIRKKILGYKHNNYGEEPSIIVVSWDIYRDLEEEGLFRFGESKDEMLGMLISVLQGEKNNQILLFKQRK